MGICEDLYLKCDIILNILKLDNEKLHQGNKGMNKGKN